MLRMSLRSWRRTRLAGSQERVSQWTAGQSFNRARGWRVKVQALASGSKAMNGAVSKKPELSKRGKKSSTYRRIVTGNVNGRSVVQSDEQMQAYQFKTVPGYEHTLIWLNAASPDLSKEQRFDRYPDWVVPGPGGTSLPFVTFPARFGVRRSVLRWRGRTRRSVDSPEGISRSLRKGRSGDAQDKHCRLRGCLRWRDLARA